MAEFYISNNGDSTDSNLSVLTRVDFNHFKINSTLLPSPIICMPCPARSHSPHIWACLILKSPSSMSRREPRETYWHILHSRVTSTTTPSTAPSIPLQRHKALGTFSTPNSAPSTVTSLTEICPSRSGERFEAPC